MSEFSQSTDAVPLVQYWHDGKPPEEIAELLGSFRRHNPGMRHLVFDERSAATLIGEHFGEGELRAFRSCAVPAMQADYFRYCAVYVLGGVYSDADLRCRGDLSSLSAGAAGTLFGAPQKAVVNGFFAFAPRHPLLHLALRVATANIERRTSGNVWWTTGPLVFSALAGLHWTGSFEAFLDLPQCRRPERGEDGKPTWNPELICEAVGEYSHLARAFEDVRILPTEEIERWISRPSTTPAYKATSSHWLNFSGSIYR